VEPRRKLGIALAQYLVRQCLDLQDRIESMAVHKTPERVMLALLQLAAPISALRCPTALCALPRPLTTPLLSSSGLRAKS